MDKRTQGLVLDAPRPMYGSTTTLALLAARQRDQLVETVYDQQRCGASAVVAAALLAGPGVVRRLVAHLSARSTRPVLMRRVERILAQKGELDTKCIQILQDVLQSTYGQTQTAHPGSSRAELRSMLDATGLTVLPRRPAVGALPDALRPGECAVVSYATRNGRHAVLFGRDASGRTFVFDASQKESAVLFFDRHPEARSYLHKPQLVVLHVCSAPALANPALLGGRVATA